MIRFKKSFYFLNVSEVWFGVANSLFDSLGLTVSQHIGKKVRKVIGVHSVSYTVENRLDVPEELIFSKFNQTLQVEIKQASRFPVHCYFDNDKTRFLEFYNDFANSRKIDLLSMKRLNEMDKFLKMSFAELDGVTIAAHSYLFDEQQGIVRLMHAASARFNEKLNKQAVGKINKLLHYHDMLHFKKQGFCVYDFGGYAENTTDPGMLGINRFKLSFGGVRVPCYNFSSYLYFIVKKIAVLSQIAGKRKRPD